MKQIAGGESAMGAAQGQLTDTQGSLTRLRGEHDMLLERYAAQVRAFEDAQASKSTLQEEIEVLKRTVEQTAAESAVAAATRELENVQLKFSGGGEESRLSAGSSHGAFAGMGGSGLGATGGSLDPRVRMWLQNNELTEYEALFLGHEVEFETIPYLTESDLLAMGVKAVGPRRKLLTACQIQISNSPLGGRLRQRAAESALGRMSGTGSL